MRMQGSSPDRARAPSESVICPRYCHSCTPALPRSSPTGVQVEEAEMSRFSGRLRSLLVCAALLMAAGCAGVTGSTTEPDLLQALPEPSPAPTAVPTPPPGRRSGANGVSNRDASGVEWRPVSTFDFNESALDRR